MLSGASKASTATRLVDGFSSNKVCAAARAQTSCVIDTGMFPKRPSVKANVGKGAARANLKFDISDGRGAHVSSRSAHMENICD